MTVKTAIIGAAGFLGAALHRALEQAGHQVIPVLRGDALPKTACDMVVDCAGESRRYFCNSDPGHAFAANVAATAERVLGIKTGLYVYASTIDVYGAGKSAPAASHEDCLVRTRTLDGYSFTKALAEQVVERYAARSLILRLGTLIGPGLRKNPVYDVVNGQPLRISDSSTLSLVDVRFVAEALSVLHGAGVEGTFNVTGRGPVKTGDIITSARALRPDLDIGFHTEREDFHYDLSVEKLSRMMPVPDGLDMLKRYLGEELCDHGRA